MAARIDLGILERTDRVWASDCIDPLERQHIQRWTGLLLPPELSGRTSARRASHTTKRTHAGLPGGHGDLRPPRHRVGPDADLGARTSRRCGGGSTSTRRSAALLHTGDVVHADPANPALLLEGVVAQDKREAIYRLAAIDHTLTWPPGLVTLPGLDPDLRYRVRLQPPGEADAGGPAPPPWTADGVVQPGSALAEIGVQAPLLETEQLVIIRAQAV